MNYNPESAFDCTVHPILPEPLQYQLLPSAGNFNSPRLLPRSHLLYGSDDVMLQLKTELPSATAVNDHVSQLVHRVERKDERQSTKILNTLHDYLRGKVRRMLLVVYLPCREKLKKVSVDSLLRTVKTEFRTRGRFPVRIHTRPTRIPKSCRVVAELVGKASLSAEAAEALRG
jgi:hypothetical protein